MMRDPIVEEVRAIRRKIEEECGNDPERYYQRIRQAQERYADRVVSLGPKRAGAAPSGAHNVAP